MEAVLLQAAGSSSRAGQGGSSSSRPAAAERHRKIQQGGGHTAQTRRRDKRGEDERATPSRTVCDIERGGEILRFHVFVDTGELFNRGRFVLLLGKLSVRHPARSAN